MWCDRVSMARISLGGREIVWIIDFGVDHGRSERRAVRGPVRIRRVSTSSRPGNEQSADAHRECWWLHGGRAQRMRSGHLAK